MFILFYNERIYSGLGTVLQANIGTILLAKTTTKCVKKFAIIKYVDITLLSELFQTYSRIYSSVN